MICPKASNSVRQVSFRGLKIHVANKQIFHFHSLLIRRALPLSAAASPSLPFDNPLASSEAKKSESLGAPPGFYSTATSAAIAADAGALPAAAFFGEPATDAFFVRLARARFGGVKYDSSTTIRLVTNF